MEHIIVRVKSNSKKGDELLLNCDLGKAMLEEWSLCNNMTIVGCPTSHTFDTVQGTSDSCLPGGYSSVVLLAESHASIHTYPERSVAYLDMFSCKSLDVDMNVEFMSRIFDTQLEMIHISKIKREEGTV